jgi:Tfp pilus assembly protein PilE
MINFENSNQAATFITELFVYVKQSNLSGLDAGAALAKVQSLQGQIQSITSSTGGTTDSWLIDQLQQQQSQANFYSSIAIATAAIALISCFAITDYLTTVSIKRAQSGNSIVSSKTEVAIDPTFKHRFYWRIFAAASVGIVVGIAVSIPTVALLVYSSATGWTPTPETLAYSAVYGIALAAVIWFQSRDTISRQRQG